MLVLTEDQALLRENAQRFARDKMPIAQLRHLRDSNDPAGFDRTVWRQMTEMGWTGFLIPEDFGGTDFGYLGAAILCEEMARTLGASPFISTALLAATALRFGGSPAQKEQVLPRIVEGMVVALAVDEKGKHDPDVIAAQAKWDGKAYRLAGTKVFVADAGGADQFIFVAHRAGEGASSNPSLFLVERDAAGVTIDRRVTVDGRNVAHVTFDDVKVGREACLDSGTNDGLLDRVLTAGRIGFAAELMGIADEAFTRTVAYVKERRQFDRRIASFQAIQHRLAHLFSELEVARSTVVAAAQALDLGAADAGLLTSLAKAKTAQVARLSVSEAVQMHGGIGMTDEFDIGFFMKRARAAAEHLGDAEYHCDRIARSRGF